MATNKRKILLLLLIPVLIALSIGYFMYNKGPVDVSDVKGIPVEAVALYELFAKDSAVANAKYNEKVLDVSGVVSRTNGQGAKAVLIKTASEGANINCSLADSAAILPPVGSSVIIRGICAGIQSDADMGILGDVILNSCEIISNK